MQRKQLLTWEISGILFLIIIGSLLHFVFNWSNHLPLIGVISPVNESVWEHLKLGFWSLVLFSLIEYWFIKKESHNYFFAKGLGVLVLQATILLIFYTYRIFSATPILAIDISSYVLGCIFCQLTSYKILTKPAFAKLNWLGFGFIMVHAILLIAFTFTPPKLPIFQDSNSLTYGIQTSAR